MFEVKKDLMAVISRIEYPLTVAHAHQFIHINGLTHYFIGDSEVKCDEGDKFNKCFGIELAEVRAEINMLKDYEKHLISRTKQPEWRKEKEKFEKELELTDYVRIPTRNGFYALTPGSKIYINIKE